MILQKRKRIKVETLKQRRLYYEKIKIAKDCPKNRNFTITKTQNNLYRGVHFGLATYIIGQFHFFLVFKCKKNIKVETLNISTYTL